MKETPFIKYHKELGAKIVPFAGYNMPVEYSGITDEHINVREKLGVFDVSHMGEFWVLGPKSYMFIQHITSNDVSKLTDGQVQYSCFPNGKGGIIDDLLVYRFSDEKYLMVVNAANTEKDWNWCVVNAAEDGLVPGQDILNASDDVAQLAIQGPFALKAMRKLTDYPVEEMKFYTFAEVNFAGIENVIFSTTGYTGAGGCEIYVPNKYSSELWEAVMKAGEEYGIKPIGLGARDTLRLEMVYCLYGNDINDNTSPIEAGLGWITKFTDNNNFIDKDLLLRQKEEGVSKRLKGFEMIDRGIPRQHYKVTDNNAKIIGEVTSGTMSPMMKKGIGMAYLDKGFWKEGTEIYLPVRNKSLKAKVVKLPIYKG